MRNMGFVLAVLIIGTCFDKVASLPLYEEEWEHWKELHSKQYSTREEELHRKAVWEANNKFINEHNSHEDKHGYTLEMNEFGDLESSEFSSIYNGYRKSSLIVADFYKPVTNGSLPEMLDWREKGVVTEVKNQGHCGSCWSFSATGSLEGQHALKKGKLVSLSEQQLMDCSGKYGNDGCNGGLMVQAFLYIKDNGGDDTEESYPYTAKNESCRFNPKTVGATDFGYMKVPQGDEIALMNALYNIGPISVAMDASLQSFQFYKNGVYLNYYCSNDELDHGVLAVGYGTYKGQPYWLVKNSWGTKWGIDGYFMLARFVGNMCGIATDASYPIVK